MPSTVLAIGMFARLGAMSWTYALLWGASLVLSVTLVILLRTRWGQTQPLHKCAVLSLLVHLMLAWAMMTVRIVAGDGTGGGMGPAIRVRVVEDAPMFIEMAAMSADVPADDAPPLLETPPEETEQPPPESQAAKEEPVVEAPPLAPPAPEPAVEKAVESVAELAPTSIETAKVADVSEPRNEPAKPASPAADTTPKQTANDSNGDTDRTTPVAAATQTPVTPTTTAVASSAATPYSLRNAPGRLGLVEQQGGSGQTEESVALALRWLAAAQAKDGRWDANEFGAGQEQMVLGQNRGGAGRNADTGITALALLAFMGAGNSHLQGEYQETVHRGLDFLIRTQGADGSLFGNATLYAQMYCHSMATFALAEAQAMSGDRRLQTVVAKAVNFSLAAQNTSTGGWRYRPGDSGDTSQLGWQMMALASAQRAGLNVPAQTWSRVEQFLRSVSRGTYGGLAAYRPDSPVTTSMTAEALYCRLLLAEVTNRTVTDSVVAEATAQLLATLPDVDQVNLYYWYYATLALHYRQQHSDQAAAAWHAWNDAMTVAIVSTQVTEGRNAGSWNTNDLWGGYGGRVYTTAMAAMCLEVYYRYAQPQATDRWTASRPGADEPSR